MTIRNMTQEDVAQVAEIEKQIFSVPWSEKSFQDACCEKNNIYVVACIEETGVIAGYGGMWTVFGEGNITNMAVASEYRGKGYGKMIMQYLEKCGREKEIDIFFLEVRESNTIARKMYEALGYKNIGTRKRFYERPVEDAIIMSKM